MRALQAEYVNLTELVERHRGDHLKWLGDGVLAAFPSAADAARCGFEIQQQAGLQPPERRLDWRVGINVGEVEARGGEYFGTPVVIAQRLSSQAGAG